MLKPKIEKEKLSFIIPDRNPLYWKGRVISYFASPKNDALKAAVLITWSIFFPHQSSYFQTEFTLPPSEFFIHIIQECVLWKTRNDFPITSQSIKMPQYKKIHIFKSKSLNLINSELNFVGYNKQIILSCLINYMILLQHIVLYPWGIAAKRAGWVPDSWRWKDKILPWYKFS